ncbi:MAG: ABC transporter permease [Verrucomicrobiales bacterium]|jgi:ABC-2 type transport system permease protein|nr:ABC transporter permease [Verrucomicrobiales bacterium]
MNGSVILGLVLRYTYIIRRSVPRIIEMLFWPMLDLLVWAFLTLYLKSISDGPPSAVTFLLGAMIFWDVLFRSQQGMTVSFLEDVWARNIINVFVAPVRVREFLAATALVGLLKVLIIIVVLTVSARLLCDFDFLALGWALGPLFVNLIIMGWGIGLVTTALIMRFGQAVEMLAWAIPFLFQPLSAVFYPVSVLPAWAQPLALALPSTQVFEGMRSVLAGGPFPTAHLLWALTLNALWLAVECVFFAWMYQSTREKGYLAKLGTQ